MYADSNPGRCGRPGHGVEGGHVQHSDRPESAGPPPPVDTRTPHSARVYDYWLGGKDNYAPDRAVAEKILRAVPRQRRHVRANRAFLVRVVRYLVREAGIRQIIDIGSGLPTAPNVHQVAHEIAPDARIVYVDNDPIVLAHARALMPSADPGTVSVIAGDLRHPHTITEHLRTSPFLDPDEPTAVLLLAMLMSLTDEDKPYDVVDELLGPLPSGSFLAATHTTADLDPLAMNGYVKAATEAGMVFTPRSKPEFEQFFAGLKLVPPGVVPVLAWRPDSLTEPDPNSVYIYSGVGQLP
jgi:S-adenosyl methyltransferase